MTTKEELLKQLDEIEQQEKQQPQTESQIDLNLAALQLRVYMRLLKDKEKQVGGGFKRGIMEIDPTRKDNSKTLNQIRNEIDEINYNMTILKSQLPLTKVNEIQEAINKEKDD